MNNNLKINTMPAMDLMIMKFPQRSYCVQDIIPKGLSILTAKEHMEGLSWLTLDLCGKVASGTELWDMESQQGAVLYVTQENMLAVIRNRIRSTRKRVPNGFYIGAMPEESLPLAIEAVSSFADAHKDGALAVIELESPVAVMEHKAYVDPELLVHYQRLKKLAEQRDLAVLVVQPSVPSANGHGVWVSDTVDALFEMLPETENQATLYRTSKVYGGRNWKLTFDASFGTWELE